MGCKTVLITGANGGIGLATAKLFTDKGYFVFAHYHNSKKNLEKLEADNLSAVQGNLEYAEDIDRVFHHCIESKGRIDILVNIAGILPDPNPIEDISLDEFDHVLGINLRAPFRLSQLAFRQMKENRWGRIINLSSIGVKYGGNPKTPHYTISKAALEAMTLSFAKAGASFGVLVNAIRVGLTNTQLHHPSKNLKERVALIPMQRMAEPEEIANYIYYLANDENTYITASIHTVAGGE